MVKSPYQHTNLVSWLRIISISVGLADLPNQGKAAVLPVFPAMATPAKKIQLILQFPQSILMKGVSALIFNHDFWLDFSQTKSLQVSGQPFSCLSKSMALNTGNDDGLQIAWLSK